MARSPSRMGASSPSGRVPTYANATQARKWLTWASALLPALVNAHTHLELTHHAGHVPDGLPLIEWMARWCATAGRAHPMTSSARLRRRRDAAGEWHGGRRRECTFGQSVRPLIESGLYGVVYYELLGPDPAQARDLLHKGQRQIEQWRREYPQDRIRFGLAPHTPFTVSAELLRAVAEWCRSEDVPLSIHAAESPAETQFLRDATGAIADLLYASAGWPVHPERAPGASPITYLDQLGVLAARPLLAHGVQVDMNDVARIARANAAVAHCPRSNTRLQCGRMPYELYRTAGVRMALGTDSLASSPSLAVWDDAIYAHALHTAAGETLTPAELLRLATLGRADALGLADKLGTLEPGKLAALACVPLDALTPTERADTDTVLATLVAGRVKPERYPSTSACAYPVTAGSGCRPLRNARTQATRTSNREGNWNS